MDKKKCHLQRKQQRETSRFRKKFPNSDSLAEEMKSASKVTHGFLVAAWDKSQISLFSGSLDLPPTEEEIQAMLKYYQ